jgi:hypothetical protein
MIIYSVFILDYEPLSPISVTLEPSSNRSCFTGRVVDDLIGLEGVEDFMVRLRDPEVPGVQVGNNATMIAVVDDDGKY